MKKKIYFIVIASIIIIALLIPFVFAVVPTNFEENAQFFSVDSTTKTAGSILEMNINLDAIDYNSFIFTLENSSNLTSNVDTSQLENIEIEKDVDNLTIIGNKTDINVTNIKLYYQIPQNLEVGTILTFSATIEENTQNENRVKTEDMLENKEQENETNDYEENNLGSDNKNQEEKLNKQTIEISITIVAEIEDNNDEKQNTNNQNEQEKNNSQDFDKTQQSQNDMQEQNKQEQNMQITSQGSSSTSITLNSSTKSSGNDVQSEIVTYNGSSNNYLESLSIQGYDFTKEFSKENTIYFVELNKDIASLDVTAIAEDNNAKICIYGNENVKEGSKILISVTAENGNVRIYRIYVV